MLSKIEAEELLLTFLNRQDDLKNVGYGFAIIDSKLSPKNDYWIIRANSESYVSYLE